LLFKLLLHLGKIAFGYDARVGKLFTQMDTWMGRDGQPVTLNMFLYTHSDPVNGIDPSGYMTMITQNFTTKIQGALRGRNTANFRVFIKESAEQGACFMITELAEKEVGKILSGIYVIEDGFDREGKPYVGRSEDIDNRHPAERVKRKIARIEFAIDDMFDKFGFKDEKKKFKNHLRLIEQFVMDHIRDQQETDISNKREEVAKKPKSKNSQALRKILEKIKMC
jgi:hypothetical protein